VSKVQLTAPYWATVTDPPVVAELVATPAIPVRLLVRALTTRTLCPCVPLLFWEYLISRPEVQVPLQVKEELVVPLPVGPVAPVAPAAPLEPCWAMSVQGVPLLGVFPTLPSVEL
jgi:hypothetical protein